MKKNRIIGLLVIQLCNTNAAFAAFDIYGVDEKIQKKIYSCCELDILEHEKKHLSLFKSTTANLQREQEYKQSEESILNKINKLGHFSFIKISIIQYQNNKANTTIDIVDKKEKDRLPNSPKRIIKKKFKTNEGVGTLLALWEQYQQRNVKLFQANLFTPQSKTCPVLHCTWGFDNEEQTLYLNQFINGSIQHKKQLMDLIRYSANPFERENAVFLLAHHNHYQDIALFLVDYIDDSNEVVRNNVMRVLAAILAKHKLNKFPLEKILQALNYPYVTDRNKAAYVLFNIVNNNKATHQKVINHSGKILVKLLKLKQPNNHDLAFQILKIISGEKYKENDIKSWDHWVNKHIV